MMDVLFVDIPCLQKHTEAILADEMKEYYIQCAKIINNVTNTEYSEKELYYSSGILCLSSYLKKNIPKINIGYMHYLIDKELFFEKIQKTKVLAFSTMTYTMDVILELAKKAKEINPAVHILLGGYHASYYARKILEENPFIECILIKEGEYAFLQYLKGVTCEQIPGLAYRGLDNQVYVNTECKMLESEEIPIPDYSLIEDRINLFNISISTMRGCVGNCRFCVNRDYWSKPRFISIQKTISELIYLKTILEKGTVIHINDNVFTVDEKRLDTLYSQMYINGLVGYFNFECDTLASFVSERNVKMLQKIGIIKVCLGFEDCNNDVIQQSNKPVSFQQNVNAAKLIKATAPNICVYAYWLIGLPGSTLSTMEENIDTMEQLIKQRIVDLISPKVFIPYPGTEFFSNFRQYGIIELSYNWQLYERRNPPYPYKYSNISEDIIFSTLIKAFRRCHEAYIQIHKEERV